MGTFRLICHPTTPSAAIEFIEVQVERHAESLWLRYFVECELDMLELPLPGDAVRTDGLWQHTCFEAFIGGDAYSEFNFSPSSQWAAYDFASYREGMRSRPIGQVEIGNDASESHFALEATFDLGSLQGNLGLAAVIEETDGTKSYWALAYPPGKPDFHHPACFAATLPPPEAP